MNQKLTKEKALKLHREMWGDMQKELGDNPSYFERLDFKHEWCKKHGFIDVYASCFLCEYSVQHHQIRGKGCNCPIDWKQLTGIESCSSVRGGYDESAISDILALPERKKEE